MKRPHHSTTTKPEAQLHTNGTRIYNTKGSRRYGKSLLHGSNHIHSNKTIRYLITFCILIIFLIHAYLVKITLKRSVENQYQIPAKEELSLNALLNYKLEPISSLNQEYYTIRMNTWKRNEQLLLSINQHSKCEGVLQIQVIWCDKDEKPPNELVHHPSGKVVIEYHSHNSLNERFNIISQPPTIGILSLDDDLIYPCAALDSGFMKWAQNPHRMVGYDARSHVVDKSHWKYGYLSQTNQSNEYSLTLPRACFLHRDYFNLYINSLPRSIIQTVEENFNCEDIAMSFFVSFMNHGEPPLLVSFWATQMRTKLYVPSKISGTSSHKSIRDSCVDVFSNVLGLKDGENRLKPGVLRDGNRYGYQPEDITHVDPPKRYNDVLNVLKNSEKGDAVKFLRSLKDESMKEAMVHGMVEHTKEWSKRWNKP